jgi:hypothetical protein
MRAFHHDVGASRASPFSGPSTSINNLMRSGLHISESTSVAISDVPSAPRAHSTPVMADASSAWVFIG